MPSKRSLDNFSYKTLLTIVVVLLIGIVALLRITSKPKDSVEASWWNETWKFRRAIDVANTGGLQSDVYLVVTIDTSDPSKFKANAGDLRFTTYNGQLLDYYLVSGVGTSTTSIQVNFASLEAGSQTIYAYYGNSLAPDGFSHSPFTTAASSSTPTISQSEELSPAPIAHWKFDEGAGTTAYDSSGINHGTITGATWQTGENCISNNCLYFNGTSSSNVTVTNSPSLQIINSQTITLWVKPTSFGARRNPINKAYGGEGTMTLESNGTINYYWGTCGGNCSPYQGFSSSAIQLNQWNQISIVRNLDTGKLSWFINGIKTNETNTSYLAAKESTANLIIGTGYAGSFLGYIDEIKIYPFARTSEQILANYNDGLSGVSTSKGSSTVLNSPLGATQITPPVAHYKFDEGYGSAVNNFVGSNTGTAHGADWTSNGKFGKALKLNINEGNAILNYTTWKEGQTGSATGFSQNGSTTENYRVLDSDPWGRKVPVWEARPDAVSGADGGWNTPNFSVDQTKMYRFSVWIRRTILGNGSYYIGTRGYNSVGSNFGVLNRSNGSINTNPYFRATSGSEIVSTNSWFLLVGHVWPVGSGTGSAYTDTGLYNTSGTKIVTPGDFVWQNGTVNAMHRSYLYYSTNIDTRQQWVYPRVDIIDGTEPSIQDLLNGFDSYGDDIVINVPDSKETISFWYDPNSAGDWQHFAKSSSTYYVDGIPTTPSQFPAYVLGDDIFMGRTSSSDFTAGSLDEVKIYDYALTQDQIKIDMNQGSAFVMGSSTQNIGGTTTSLDYCIPGDTSHCDPPIAEWKFEENTGSTAFDTSGNNNHGAFGVGNSAPTWIAARNGAALSFDGQNDYVSSNFSPDINTDPFTISAWAYKTGPNTTRERIISDYATTYLNWNTDNTISFMRTNAALSYQSATSTTTFSSNTWYFITGVYDGSKIDLYVNGQFQATNPIGTSGRNFDNINIGRDTTDWSGFFNGKIDNVLLYSYARTPAQIAYDYNQGAPVAHWKMDECQGTTIYDSSGNNLHGTLSVGSSGTQTSAGTCQTTDTAWGDGSSGKLNSSIYFDGTDDEASLNNKGLNNPELYGGSYGSSTSSFWLKSYESGTIANGFAQYMAGFHYFQIRDNAGGRRLRLMIGDIAGDVNYWPESNSSIPSNEWVHVVFVIEGGVGCRFYINGKLDKDISHSGLGIKNYSAASAFGRVYNQNFNGQIDDVRIYNYALTNQQVKTIYNNGAVSFQ